MVSHGLTIALLLCAAVWAQDPDPTVGVDVFSVATNGADPDPGTGVFIPPSGGSGQVPNITFGRRTGKSNDPCQGHFVPVSQRQYFEMAAHPNQWLCADNGFSPGIHRVCADLQTLPRTCYDPNHQTPQMQGIVQNCLDRRTSCGRLLQQENCKDIFLLQSELRGGRDISRSRRAADCHDSLDAALSGARPSGPCPPMPGAGFPTHLASGDNNPSRLWKLQLR